MDFVVSKATLLKELQAMQGVVEKKSTIPILSNIVLDVKKGRLDLLATDLEVGIRTSCDAHVSAEGSATQVHLLPCSFEPSHNAWVWLNRFEKLFPTAGRVVVPHQAHAHDDPSRSERGHI